MEFKLQLILYNSGKLLKVCFTPGGVDHHGMALLIVKGFIGDHGSLSNKLFKFLMGQGVELFTKLHNNLEPRFLMIDRILLRRGTLD